MSLYQLFNKPPTKNILNKLLYCFDLKSLDDNKIFTKKDLNELKSIELINDIILELSDFYLPCKSKKYLVDLNNKKIITILRQFLRHFDYFVYSKRKIYTR